MLECIGREQFGEGERDGSPIAVFLIPAGLTAEGAKAGEGAGGASNGIVKSGVNVVTAVTRRAVEHDPGDEGFCVVRESPRGLTVMRLPNLAPTANLVFDFNFHL